MARDENFLSRWSRKKTQARQPGREVQAEPAPVSAPVAPQQSAPGARPPSPPAEKAPLPPVESLTPESDFSPFMAPDVEPDMRHKALKALFSDPHFNAMDMLDVYVDDYSKPDPIPEAWLAKLEQVSRFGDRGQRDRDEAAKREAKADPGEAASEAVDAPDPGESAPADAPPPARIADHGGEEDPDLNPPRKVGESRG